MIYLNEKDLREIGVNWNQLIDEISGAVAVLSDNNYAQPIKPYLRYNNPVNRIIAMPAYIGGKNAAAGIKWIASFPDNIHHGLQRAHAVSILNEVDTGIPLCIINTNLISAIRTSAVSATIVHHFLKNRKDQDKLNVGIVGFGPIGQLHQQMISDLLGSRMGTCFIYDIKEVDTIIKDKMPDNVRFETSLDFFGNVDVFITCTVSSERYINVAPKKGSLHLNVSLRDYLPEFIQYVDCLIVDDWKEVCRENTDIEVMYKQGLISQEDTHTIQDVVCRDLLSSLDTAAVIMFNPMGMAVFDVAIGAYYYRRALAQKQGTMLD